MNEARSGAEDCVGVGGIALFGVSLSLMMFVRQDLALSMMFSIYVTLGVFLLLAIRKPIGESQPDRFYGMVELRSCRGYGHAGIAEDDFTWRTGGCGDPRRHRRSLNRARASKAACRTSLTP
jgi:hypothetical protein